MSDSSPDFINDMLRRIMGIEITITSLVGKRKLSQNKETRDRLGAAEALLASGNTELAQCMREAE